MDPVHFSEKRDQCFRIRRVRKHPNSHYIFARYGQLQVVCRLQLPVPHVVFFHPHKRGVMVRFGIAVPFSQYGQMGFVRQSFFPVFGTSFKEPLQRFLPMAAAVYEWDVPFPAFLV